MKKEKTSSQQSAQPADGTLIERIHAARNQGIRYIINPAAYAPALTESIPTNANARSVFLISLYFPKEFSWTYVN